jgi:hypothetical protein
MATAPGGVEVASVSAASSGGSSFGGGSGVGRHCRWLLAGWLLALGRLVLRARETQRAGGRADRCEASGRQLAPGGRVWGARRSPPHTMLCVC